ncbi:VOC family protein [Anthocerotibacter panamensis]|uniref:hypothetical protein n=1 Tax=Anthocerotibacter panamensis TaxID=2857077 RepID=UPI001C401F41|nr:hypothetical protein [Anthocerotibacter panamensis]
MDFSSVLVTLATPEVETLVAFYARLLDSPPTLHLPGRYAEFQCLGLRLGIFQPRSTESDQFVGSPKSAWSLCLEVVDLEEAMAQLTALGYPPPGVIVSASHGREIYAFDPMGHRLILHQPH